jgi:hypothetical protein
MNIKPLSLNLMTLRSRQRRPKVAQLYCACKTRLVDGIRVVHTKAVPVICPGIYLDTAYLKIIFLVKQWFAYLEWSNHLIKQKKVYHYYNSILFHGHFHHNNYEIIPDIQFQIFYLS